MTSFLECIINQKLNMPQFVCLSANLECVVGTAAELHDLAEGLVAGKPDRVAREIGDRLGRRQMIVVDKVDGAGLRGRAVGAGNPTADALPGPLVRAT